MGAFQNPSPSAGLSQRKNAQTNPGPGRSGKIEQPDFSELQGLLKNRELMADLGQLIQKMQRGISYPPARNQSRILSRLPEGTTFYAAFPNYGETTHQAQQIFQQQMKESPELRNVLRKNNLEAVEPKIESALERFYELSQYLGDEVVIAGHMRGNEPSGILVAEVKKPGLKQFLESLNNEVITNDSDRLRLFDPQELAATTGKDAGHGPAVLIRPDFAAIALSVAELREFNSQLDQSSFGFGSTGLGQMLAQSYQEGANSLFAIDLSQVISHIPQGKPQDRIMLEKTGFADLKYLVVENRMSADGSTSWGKIIFNGPRHGIASWIAAPAHMGGLDFVSVHAAQAAGLMLKNPAQIFDDLRDITGDAAFANLPQMEAQLNINLKRDLLSKLNGELAFEMQAPAMPAPGTSQVSANLASTGPAKPGPFKIILRVSDPAGLQHTLAQLLAMAPVQIGQQEEDGVTFNTITLPSPSSPYTEINYFFLDGYLVIASDRDMARDAVRAHRSGDSLAKSGRLHDSLAAGRSANASVIFYQNAGQMLGPLLAQLPQELHELMPTGGLDTKPNVVSIYGDETALRGVTNSNMQSDMTVALIVAAIAIPNLIQSRNSANEAAAASSLRTINTAEVTYTASYPEKGFAGNLATLGPGSGDCAGNNVTPEHACLLDDVLGNSSCTEGKWCEKSGYKFAIRPVCMRGQCLNYAATATPASPSAGAKSFCSTNDAVIRSHVGALPTAPLTLAECRTWTPLR